MIERGVNDYGFAFTPLIFRQIPVVGNYCWNGSSGADRFITLIELTLGKDEPMVTDVCMETDDDDRYTDGYADGFCEGKMAGYSTGLTAAIQVITGEMVADNFANADITRLLQSLLMSVTRKYQEDVL